MIVRGLRLSGKRKGSFMGFILMSTVPERMAKGQNWKYCRIIWKRIRLLI